jgi:O-antigen ligase
VFLGLAIWVLLTRSKLRWVYRLLLVGVFLTIPAALAVLGRGGHAEERVKTAMEAPVETVLSSGRLRYWAFVLRGAPGRPVFGHGAGSFAVDAKNDDARHFPHNLFLEALYEEGGVGLLLLVGFVAVPFYRYVSWRRLSRPLGREPPVINTWFAVATSGFLAVLLHWDLADIRLVWFLFGVLTVQCLVQQQAAQRQELAPPYTTGPTDTRLALEDGGVGRPQRPRGTGPL